jgi:hypothetical protein
MQMERNNYGRNGLCNHPIWFYVISLVRLNGKAQAVTSGIIMIVFLFVGEELLHLIGIDVHSFAVAGSFVLFFLALE